MPDHNGAQQQTLISKGARVTLHFALALTDGSEVDSNFGHKPASFIVGDGSLLPGFEAVLMDRQAGDEVKVTLPPEQAFGAVNQANVQHLPRARFAGLLASASEPVVPGTVLAFADGAGNDIPGVVQAIDNEIMVVDFNHPLAGRDIVFRASVVTELPPGVQTVSISDGDGSALRKKAEGGEQ